MDISASGLTANRRWMDAIAENLANAQTTRTAEGGPYKRKVTSFREVIQSVRKHRPPVEHRLEIEVTQNRHLSPSHSGTRTDQAVKVEAQVEQQAGEPRWVYDPHHPDANEEGYVAYPQVEVVQEMVDLIGASRSYEANVTALNTAKAMNKKALEI
jgi:flagellar basal-body rod protein FlgC